MTTINLPPSIRDQEFRLPDALRENDSEFRFPDELQADEVEINFHPPLEEEDESEPASAETSVSVPDHSEERRYKCPDCGLRVTRGLSGKEYGHRRGRGDQERCPRRKSNVDPQRPTASQSTP